ncbi:uncharacterized protein LOC132748167 [Ruditapes philippinarum]|uniref:uncharacterized protein LOC132748167 n=1 Tax=Ruditapes philippinarum TaxID=129788 RepID=UPI00295A84DC|nr:uncharacterized protein LOC132748167 [Ruditapes philippinarum]
MDLSGIPPPVMNWQSSNLIEQWQKFKLNVELIFSGPLKSKSEEEKVSYLLLWIGDEGREVYRTWDLSAEDAKKLNTYYVKYKDHVQPKLNPIFARYQFMNEIQGSDSIDAFVTRLRNKATDCQFTDKNENIRDRIVFGCNSSKVREKLINEGEKLTLDKAIQIAQNYEYCQKQMATMGAAAQQPIDAVKTQMHYRRKQSANGPTKTGRMQGHGSQNVCGRCGTRHDQKTNCPAKGATCYKCNKLNHFSKQCKSQKNAISVNQIGDNSDIEENLCNTVDGYSINTVSTSLHSPDCVKTEICLGPNKCPISFKIDTGSAANILPKQQFQKLNLSTPLEAPDCKLTSYTGEALSILGTVMLTCYFGNQSMIAKFYVVDRNASPL